MSHLETAVLIDDAARAEDAITAFRAYPKLLSWLVLHAAGVPALTGIVVSQWNAEVARAVTEFASRWTSHSVLLRSDSSSESGLSPRGGFLVAASDAESESRTLLAEGRMVFLLEPASPFSDLYSANLAPDGDWREWEVEVVGPGFDASDLKRGDVTPNETVRLRFDPRGVTVQSRELATPAALLAARDIRLEKVARMIGCKPSDVDAELRRLGETMLLDTPCYPPMPESLLGAALAAAKRLRPTLARHRLGDQRVMLSLSFITRDARLVFWDVVWPHAKYVRGAPTRHASGH